MLPTRSAGGRRALLGLAALVLCPWASAQDADPETATDDELRALLREALDDLRALQARVDALDADADAATPDDDDLEAQLQALLGESSEPTAQPATPPRTVFPSAYNPRIGVFMDAVIDAGNAEETLGEGDRFSLRETEVDLALPLAPFAEGVLVLAFEDVGGGEFESAIEEGYAALTLAELFGVETRARARLGRFRLPFGRDNRLHTHDLPQVDRNVAVAWQLGEEGILGDGVMLTTPIGAGGDGQATTLDLAVVNGEVLTGGESLLGEAADEAGLALDSDGPLAVTRLSHFVQSDDGLSDVEFGASWLAGLTGDAVTTDAGTEIEPEAIGLDATLRTRDDESGRGSWLVQGEVVRTNLDFGPATAAGFPVGRERTHGWSLSAQRQIGPASYLGLRTGAADMLASDDSVVEHSAWWSWYADEFFRVRVQGQHLSVDDGGADESVWRTYVQFTWNFGAHLPHPYWVNR